MTPHQRWTQSDLTDLRLRLQAGHTIEQIAEGAGRQPDAVKLMMGRLRLRTVDA